MAVTILLLLWAACGVVGYGMTFAHFQKEFASISGEQVHSDIGFASFVALMGPIGLIATFFAGGWGHGLLFRPLTADQRRELLKAEYPEDPYMWD